MLSKINSLGCNIYIGNDSFSNLNELLSSNNYSKIIVIVDENTEKYCLPLINNFVKNYSLIKIESGEINKNIETCSFIWGELNNINADRNSLIINLGGGVICDMGGFVASTFKRGISFINIPTTLLSMVDASVGGKLGVDFNNVKNLIGLFKQPSSIFINPLFFKTLEERQFISGFAEVIKHALIFDCDYFKYINNSDIKTNDIINKIILKSVEIKNTVVTKDPEEKNLRKILNFGHTIGHAIETLSLEKDEDPLLHGEAVAIGMICESYLSFKQCNLSKEELNIVSNYILKYFKKYQLHNKDYDKYFGLMQLDKKNNNDLVNFTLIGKIGEAIINQNSSKELIIESLNFYNSL